MNYEIIYECNSTNNKNVRANELKILRKFEDKLYFEFGDSENNIKKRFYNNVEVLNKDFQAIEKIKKHLEGEDVKNNKQVDIKTETKPSVIMEAVEEETKPVAFATEPKEVKVDIFKKTRNKNNKKNIF